MTGQLTILHFGLKMGEHMTDHKIPAQVWKSALDHISQLKQWTHRQLDHIVQIYQFENSTHELDASTGQMQSYIPHFQSIKVNQMISFLSPSFQSYLQYQVTSELLPEQSFLPINKYYNVNKVVRSEFSDGQVTFIFDKKETHYELMMLHWFDQNNSAETEIIPYLEMLSSIK